MVTFRDFPVGTGMHHERQNTWTGGPESWHGLPLRGLLWAVLQGRDIGCSNLVGKEGFQERGSER